MPVLYSKARIGNHPIHPMIVAFPIAFYTATFVCFLVFWRTGDPFWFQVAFYANIAAVCTALLAALPGFVDWMFIPIEHRARKVGLFHMIANVAALCLFTVNIFLIKDKIGSADADVLLPLILTGVGVGLTTLAGFLGFELIGKHHVGVTLSEKQVELEKEIS